MTLVGFKRLEIGLLNDSGQTTETYVIEGEASEGATTAAEITGLNKEATRIYGSDIAYYVSQRGTGDVVVNLSLLDLPAHINDEILGYETGEDGISYLGERTEAPECAIMLESSTLQGDTALLAFFRGKFSKDGTTLKTLTNEAFEPEAESLVFNAVSDTKEGSTKGQVVGKYIGKQESAIQSLRQQTFPGREVPGA